MKNLFQKGGSSGMPVGTPVEGMYFFLPDHLGSITMITNSVGVMLAGKITNSGASRTGQDLYQYVDGNPVMFNDPSGHIDNLRRYAGNQNGS